MDLVQGSVGKLAYDVAFKEGQLVISGGDAELGISISLAVSEKQVLDALLKLIPAGSTFATIAGAVVSIVESATEKLP